MRKTLRHEVAEYIIGDFISSGKLSAGSPLPPVRFLQKRYGVSSGTILSAIAILEAQGKVTSKVGSGCYITDNAESVERVSKSGNGNGNGSHNGTKNIGLICNSTEGYIMRRVHAGVDAICHQHGYSVVVTSTDFDYYQESIQVKRLIEAGCEGIILYPAVRTKEQARKDYLNSEYLDYPIVLLDLALPGHKRPQVLFDNYRAGYDMTTYLLNKGHRRIAFMDYKARELEWVHRSVMDRYNGYLAAMEAGKLSSLPEDHWVLHEHAHEDATDSVAALLHDWMEQIERPTALIALEDHRAALTISIARDLGIRVPGELEITGFDDLPMARIIRPHFTTTKPDFARAGEIGVELLLQLIRKEMDQPVVYMLPVPIKQRETKSVLRISSVEQCQEVPARVLD